MAFACREVQPWTFTVLLGAFIDLGLAYILLCVSAFVFFASKLLGIFWVCFPCPCNGVFGYRNPDLCLHKLLLIDGPVGTIRAVHKLVNSKFPLDVLWSRDQRCNLNTKLIRDVNCENRVRELQGEADSSPFSSPRLQNLVDRESGYDAKGKRVMVLKKRTGIRCSRRAAPEYGRLPSYYPSDSSKLVSHIFPFPCDDRDTREMSGESSIAIAGREDYVKAPTGNDMAESICQSSELSGSFGESKDVDISYTQEKSHVVGKETDKLRMLQEALEKEKAACAALYLELEKERAAAASAADEAMSMIARLQKDKASIEMEVRQYQRMMEEKFVYDEEEMGVLKEILLRREMENHFLEREVESYRQMSFLGNEWSDADLSAMLCESGKRPSPSVKSNTDALLTLQQTADSKSNCMEFGNIANSTSQYDASFVEKQIHPNEQDSLEKCVLSEREEKVHTDNVMCQEITPEAAQAHIGTEENLQCDGVRWHDGDLQRNLHGSMLDIEPAFYDVHVVDGKTELWKEESRSSFYTALDGSQDFASTFGATGVRSSELLQGFPSTSQVDTEPKFIASSLDMHCGLPLMDNS
ncbi:uncharacterized protein LOC126620744 [Malus sylvestris]|uniref:uncharacterized protein LOC126620744 n=1 Tax=Malus sylvestris TaxID=3752 RepID=UPI0021AC8FBB|nr:uncharacterized protein LOC126620744 [Malus sylvestris]